MWSTPDTHPHPHASSPGSTARRCHRHGLSPRPLNPRQRQYIVDVPVREYQAAPHAHTPPRGSLPVAVHAGGEDPIRPYLRESGGAGHARAAAPRACARVSQVPGSPASFGTPLLAYQHPSGRLLAASPHPLTSQGPRPSPPLTSALTAGPVNIVPEHGVRPRPCGEGEPIPGCPRRVHCTPAAPSSVSSVVRPCFVPTSSPPALGRRAPRSWLPSPSQRGGAGERTPGAGVPHWGLRRGPLTSPVQRFVEFLLDLAHALLHGAFVLPLVPALPPSLRRRAHHRCVLRPRRGLLLADSLVRSIAPLGAQVTIQVQIPVVTFMEHSFLARLRVSR